MDSPTQPVYTYTIGNSPKLPREEVKSGDSLSLELAKVQNELRQEDSIIILITDIRLNAFTISKIEMAILNQIAAEKAAPTKI